MLKLYKVDFNDGGWYSSGGRPSKLVIAESPEKAIEIARNADYGEEFVVKRENNIPSYEYLWKYSKEFIGKEFPEEKYDASAVEILFDGYELDIYNQRERAIDKVLNKEKEN